MSEPTIVLRAIFRKARKMGDTYPPISARDMGEWQKKINETIQMLGGKVIEEKSIPGVQRGLYCIDFEIASVSMERAMATIRIMEMRNRYREQLMPLHEIKAGVPKSP
jgi:hypothetical protein